VNDLKAIADEERRIRELRRTVDLALFYISAGPLDLQEAVTLVEEVKAKVLRLFPGKEETFELIYRPRFRRVLASRFGLH